MATLVARLLLVSDVARHFELSILFVFSSCRWLWEHDVHDKRLNPEAEIRSYLYRTILFNYENLWEVWSGWRETTTERENTPSLLLLLIYSRDT